MARIDDYHRYHGAALALISEQKGFTSFNKTPDVTARSAYLLNHDTGLYIKHSTKEGTAWRFTFNMRHQTEVRRLFDHYGDKTFVLLVCDDEVCLLRYGEYRSCLAEDFKNDRWLEITRPKNGGFRVRGAGGNLKCVVPANRFPKALMA